jgi:hypothetical protein
MTDPVEPTPEPLEGVKDRDSGEAEVDLDHDLGDDQPARTWIHPEKCPACGEDLIPVPETFTYHCSKHVWKKEQFIDGDLDKPSGMIGI